LIVSLTQTNILTLNDFIQKLYCCLYLNVSQIIKLWFDFTNTLGFEQQIAWLNWNRQLVKSEHLSDLLNTIN